LIENVFAQLHPTFSPPSHHSTAGVEPDVARAVLVQLKDMASKRYPQFLLIGDSIVQYSNFLRDGFSFGAVLAERECDSFTISFNILSQVARVYDCSVLEISNDLADCQRRLDVINRGLVSVQVPFHLSQKP
jgi:hypothetical protein